jgi:catechol 2,3-dioxygenase-like lactoylglutathione lyase family enzyme
LAEEIPSPSAPMPSSSSADWEIQQLFHFIVNASNFERSIAFYTRLGFKLLRDNRDVVWPEYVGQNFGMSAAQGRGALLALGDSENHTRLDLIEWLEPRWENPDEPPSPTRVPRVMALRSKKLRAAYQELSAEGFEFIGVPRDADPLTGVESVVCLRDPDGYIVELIEYIGGRLGSRVEDLETRTND